MNLSNEFYNLYGKNVEEEFFAPGRVNIIGEHIDYNGGLVLPCIIDRGTYAYVAKRNDKFINVYSMNFKEDGIRTINLEDLEYRKEDGYSNYIKAIFKYMLEKGLKVDYGLDILIYGTIPNGGLSSSASFEILICNIIQKMYNFDISDLECILLSVRVENEYIGLNSGIMDQYSIKMGKKDYATLIDCNNKTHEYIKFLLPNQKLLILNTNKHRTNEESKYNERVKECREALNDLKQELDINNLCDISPEIFEKYKYLIKNDINRKRAEHVIYENDRVKKATIALNSGDLDELYKLMRESHESLRDKYEVTGLHLDSIVESCFELGIKGARMTGAGFGGNAICIINNDELYKIDEIKKKYYEKTGYNAEIIITQIGK